MCSLYEGDTFTLTLSNLQGRTSTWTSSNNTIASVVDGVVTAYKAGTATITAKVDKYEVSCEVTVLYLNPDCVITYKTESGQSISPSMWYPYYTGIKTIGTLISDKYNNGIGKLIFQDPVTSIPKEAFYYDGHIHFIEISLPNSIKSIGENAFMNTYVKTIKLGDSLETIGYGAFKGTKLETLILPGSVKEIGQFAFYECNSLRTITLSNSLKTIGSSAFSHCTNLASVTFSNSLTTIGEYAFYDCSNIKSISIPNSVTSIEQRAFADCTSLASVTLSNSLERIEEYVFSSCPITGILNIPKKLKHIGTRAFDGSHFDGVNLNDLSAWCSTELDYLFYDGGSLYTNSLLYVNNKRVSDLIIPNNVSSINARVFYHFVFDSVTIPGSVTSIGENAIGRTKKITVGKIIETQPLQSFCFLPYLDEVIIDNSATSVVKEALSTALKDPKSLKVTMPETIKSIGDHCICAPFLSIDLYIYATTPPEIGNNSYEFFDTNDNSRIFVPKNSVNRYKDKYPWSRYKSIIYPIE